MESNCQLILFPGLGADQRLLEPQRQAFPQLIVPPWIEPKRRESLSEYAARMAASIRVSRDEPLVLGGVSFGGMLAYEMARRLKPQAVVLIASCRTRQGLRSVYRAGRRLLPLIPIQAWSLAKLLADPLVRLRSNVSEERRNLAVTMLKEMDSRFMNWVLHAILHWNPTPPNDTVVFHIHGARDIIIPACGVTADELIPDGGHLINVTHPERVNAFLRMAIGHHEKMSDAAPGSHIP